MSTITVDYVVDPVYFDPTSTLRGVVDFLTVAPAAPKGVAVIGADPRFATVVTRAVGDNGAVTVTTGVQKVADIAGPRTSLPDLMFLGLAIRLGVPT